jgi:hypothetical protein
MPARPRDHFEIDRCVVVLFNEIVRGAQRSRKDVL